jgi:hypothetical protein
LPHATPRDSDDATFSPVFLRFIKSVIQEAKMLSDRYEAQVGRAVARKISIPTKKLAKEILSYFLRNPQAADSLKGVAQWRLLEERVRRQVDATDAALQWLVKYGFLIRVSPCFTEPVYRLNAQKRGEAEQFLNSERKRARKRSGLNRAKGA